MRQVKQITYAWNFSLKDSCYWLFSLKVRNRDNFMNYLRKKGISSGVHLMPLPLHPIYRKYNKGVKEAISTWESLVSLPFFPDIKKDEVDYIIKNVKDYFRNK